MTLGVAHHDNVAGHGGVGPQDLHSRILPTVQPKVIKKEMSIKVNIKYSGYSRIIQSTCLKSLVACRLCVRKSTPKFALHTR